MLGALQLRVAWQVDLAAPIVTLQRDVLALDRLRAWRSLTLGVPWWLLWIARALARRPPSSPRIRRILDRFAATRLRRAAEQLGEVARFSDGL